MRTTCTCKWIQYADYMYVCIYTYMYTYMYMYMSSPTRGSSFFLGKVTSLGVLYCFALFV